MKYSTENRNHVIIKGREQALTDFIQQDYNGMKHKVKNAINSNSEDALTWSCFETISYLPYNLKINTLDEILEDAYEGECDFKFINNTYTNEQIEIFIGKKYTGKTINESTEVDASIELPDKIIFIEAKLYSSITLADDENNKPYDQIARKLRVGLDIAGSKDFYFLFLDLAPIKKLNRRKSKIEALDNSKGGYYDKWKSAWWFNYYKKGRNNSLKPLKEILINKKTNQQINQQTVEIIAMRMGWLTWSDLYKNILRGVLKKFDQENQ
jgi:hypothetical protein